MKRKHTMRARPPAAPATVLRGGGEVSPLQAATPRYLLRVKNLKITATKKSVEERLLAGWPGDDLGAAAVVLLWLWRGGVGGARRAPQAAAAATPPRSRR